MERVIVLGVIAILIPVGIGLDWLIISHLAEGASVAEWFVLVPFAFVPWLFVAMTMFT